MHFNHSYCRTRQLSSINYFIYYKKILFLLFSVLEFFMSKSSH